jgi:hypothetical protein
MFKIWRFADNGRVKRRHDEINFTGIGGPAAALTVTYYPEPSITAAVVASTFLISMATDVGGYLRLEFR